MVLGGTYRDMAHTWNRGFKAIYSDKGVGWKVDRNIGGISVNRFADGKNYDIFCIMMRIIILVKI